MVAKLRWTAPVLFAAPSADGPRKWTSRAYTGGLMRPSSPKLDAPLILDLAGAEFASSVVANLFHDETRIVGHVTEKLVAQSAVDVGGVVSGGGADAEHFLKAAGDGFPWQASLEADLSRVQKTPVGRSVQVNGQMIAGPVYVARHSRIYGVAFLGRGADESTSVVLSASAADGFFQGEIDMDYSQWLAAMGLEESTLTDAQKAKLKAKFDGEKAAILKAGSGDDIDSPAFDLDRLKAAYASHEADLETRTFKYAGKVKDHEVATLKAGAMQAAVGLKSKALAEEWAPERFEVEALKAAMAYELSLVKAEAPKGPAIHSGHNVEINGLVLEAAACQSLGLPDHEKRFNDQTLQAAHTEFKGRIGLQQILLVAAARNGYNCRAGEQVDDGNLAELIDYAFPSRRELRAAGASILSLSGILGNVANAELAMGFNIPDQQQWREIAQIRSVRNFFKVTTYRMLDNFEYEELAPDGTMKHGQVGEESYDRQVRTYAKMFSLTRQDWINDNLGAFDDLRTRLGRGAGKKFLKVFWTKFLANSSFFTAARGNYLTGATTTLLTDYVGLQLGLTAFRDLKTAAVAPATEGERYGGEPRIILVPTELETNAQRIYAPIAAATAATTNIWSGKYRPVVVPQLSDSAYSGSSALAWYLFRDKADLAPMVVSFLNGVESPTVKTAETSIDRLGVDFAGYHDFGADFSEWLAGIKVRGS